MANGFLGIGDNRSDGDVFQSTNADGSKGYTYSGFFTDDKATYKQALASGNTAAARALYKTENDGATISDADLKIEMDAAGGKQGLDWGMSGIGGAVSSIGGLGLGVLSYMDSHKVNNKNLQLMDQQIAANDVTAKRSADNYKGLHGNWGKIATPTTQTI